MDRRTFLQMSALSPTLVTMQPVRTVRAQFIVNQAVSAQMIITAHATPHLAEDWQKGWHHRAFEGEGEWYLQTSARKTLPSRFTALGGTLMLHQFVIGYAAAERSMLVGTFRREHIAAVIRVMGDHQAELIALADWFAIQPLPERWELIWNGAQLQRFVPTTEGLGMTIEPNESLWP